jgi:hypothetical protein
MTKELEKMWPWPNPGNIPHLPGGTEENRAYPYPG